MTAPDSSNDLQTMIGLARTLVNNEPLPEDVKALSVREVVAALAHTILVLAETPKKELKLAPTEAEMAKLRQIEEAAQ